MAAMRWVLAGALGAGAIMGAPAFAQTQHLAEAMIHVRAAVAAGKQGSSEALLKQAQEALTHVESAKEKAANVHLDEVVSLLKDAIAHAKQGRKDLATAAAEEALIRLTPVAPAAPGASQGCGY